MYIVGRWSSSFSERQAAEEAHAKETMKTWKRVVRIDGCCVETFCRVEVINDFCHMQSLFVAIPAVSYLTWKNFIGECQPLLQANARQLLCFPHIIHSVYSCM